MMAKLGFVLSAYKNKISVHASGRWLSSFWVFVLKLSWARVARKAKRALAETLFFMAGVGKRFLFFHHLQVSDISVRMDQLK